jgi:preprotein translocase subunit SecG
MYTLLVILIVLTALLMVGIVLIQESKGGGLTSQFAAYKKLVGVNRTTNLVERTTWILAGIMVVISVACAYVAP